MKIGEFAVKNKTTIDTIRHYMDLSLITPEKKGSFYEFDDSCQNDYNTVMSLKEIGFSLAEIQTLIIFERIGRHTAYSKRETYRAFFENKMKFIEKELNRLDAMKKKLRSTLDAMPLESSHDQVKTGVPLNVLPLLYCNKCQSSYVLSEGHVENGEIISGELVCSCSDTLQIKDGILFGEGFLDPESCAAFDDSFIEDYVQTTHIDYLKNLHMSLQWARNNYDFSNSENGVILELGSGRGFFLRNMIDLFTEKSLYIAVDHNPNAQRWLKKSVSDVIGNKSVLYICCDFQHIPLKPKSIDSLVDATGSSNYAFEHSDFLLDSILPLLNKDAVLHGQYLVFKNFALNTMIPEESRKWFKKDSLNKHLNSLGFQQLREYETNPISEGGPRESFFVKGEKIYNYLYIGKFKK
ncbi:MAG: MerR family transcriptional regulator [Bacillota bacterium]